MLTREKHVTKPLGVFAKDDYDACLHVPQPQECNQISPLYPECQADIHADVIGLYQHLAKE